MLLLSLPPIGWIALQTANGECKGDYTLPQRAQMLLLRWLNFGPEQGGLQCNENSLTTTTARVRAEEGGRLGVKIYVLG